MSVNSGQTDVNTEIAGQATVDSAPSERESDAGENGLDADGDNTVTFPGPTYNLDATPAPGTTGE
jgi:hypothetical protein